MRLPRFRRCAQPVRRAILPGRHFVHHFRPRSGLPLSLGREPGGNRLDRLGDDDDFPRRACDRPCLCMEERGVGLGMSRPTILTPGAMPVAPGSSPDMMRSEEHTSELQSLMRISYAVFCLKKKNKEEQNTYTKS